MPIDRIRIEYTLAFATSFHFGTGIREGLVDRTIVRDDGGYLYVPGLPSKECCANAASSWRVYTSRVRRKRERMEEAGSSCIALTMRRRPC